MIPARFYLGSENSQVQKARLTLDPMQAKPTSQLVAEAAAAVATASATASSVSSRKSRRQPKPVAFSSLGVMPDPRSRTELRAKLEQRIAELREERRRKQSAADKARAAEHREARSKQCHPALPQHAEPCSSHASRRDQHEHMEVGQLTFDPRTADIPFDAGIGKRGAKVRQMRRDLLRQQETADQLNTAEREGRGDQLRKDLAFRKSLQRARGEKVHDDPQKLRKAQKVLESKKKKSKENWASRVEADKRQLEEQQRQRRDNLSKRRSGSRKASRRRSGFEGKRSHFLNAER